MKTIWSKGIMLRTGGSRLARRAARMRSRVVASLRAVGDRLGHRWGRQGGPVMITVTYRPGVAWEPRHISGLVRRIRRAVDAPVVWVAELQRRGAVHYHIVTWLRRGQRLPMPDLAGWWPHGASQIMAIRSQIARYVAKYVSKVADEVRGVYDDMAYPRGIRIYGVSGLSTLDRAAASWGWVPAWVRRAVAEIGSRVIWACQGRREVVIEDGRVCRYGGARDGGMVWLWILAV